MHGLPVISSRFMGSWIQWCLGSSAGGVQHCCPACLSTLLALCKATSWPHLRRTSPGRGQSAWKGRLSRCFFSQPYANTSCLQLWPCRSQNSTSSRSAEKSLSSCFIAQMVGWSLGEGSCHTRLRSMPACMAPGDCIGSGCLQHGMHSHPRPAAVPSSGARRPAETIISCVRTCQAAAVVAVDDAVRVEHRHHLEHEGPAQRRRLAGGACQVLQQATHHPAGVGLAGVHARWRGRGGSTRIKPAAWPITSPGRARWSGSACLQAAACTPEPAEVLQLLPQAWHARIMSRPSHAAGWRPPEMTAPLRRLSSCGSLLGSVMVSKSQQLPASVVARRSRCTRGALCGSACTAAGARQH